ncbi:MULTISPECIES: DUF6080 domain-containing protein [unclassified Romboutsia]|uniref:DUF6080 domain-containing protein n=1 Tax=unclassified Romboutsia TaxID=2626894 RepID=UPI003FA717AE
METLTEKIAKHKSEILLFISVAIIYLAIAIIFYSKTTIFYDTNNTYDVLLDTDTGVLFNWNTFALAQDNSKHILFMQIVSLIGYPIHLLSTNIATNFNIGFNHVYGMGLILLQILVSSASITMVYSTIKKLNIKREILALIISMMVFSFPQIFMTMNVERFIYGQLSLVFFVFLVNKLKNKESYWIDIAAIPLFGMTLTNIYMYGINLLLEFKINIKKIVKHIGVFVLATYAIIVSSRAYNSFFMVKDIVKSDTKFIQVIPMFEKLKMTLVRLLYPTMYFPSAKFENGMFLQQGLPNLLFFILFLVLFVCAIIGGIKHYKERIPQLCLGAILANITLHGIIGYNLKNANIMAIYFSFAIIILLAYFAKSLPKKYTKIFIIFLVVVLLTMIISNIQGFLQILEIGINNYPK